MGDGNQFFNKESKVYKSYLNLTNQKFETAKVISNTIQTRFSDKGKIKVLCIGGGDGSADLVALGMCNHIEFVVDNIDPSNEMCQLFFENVKQYKNIQLKNNIQEDFSNYNFKSTNYDLIFCINSVYFLNNWKENSGINEFTKVYQLLRYGGLAAIVLKSKNSDHFKIKNLLDSGHTTGEIVRHELHKLHIHNYSEEVSAEINITALFSEHLKNKEKKVLLDFLSKGKWNGLSKNTKDKVFEELNNLKEVRGRNMYLNSNYDLIWIPKRRKLAEYRFKSESYNNNKIKLGNEIKKLVGIVKDFPIKGVYFRDTANLLISPVLFKKIINYAADYYKGQKIDYIVSKDMQGVLWAGALAKEMGVGVIPMFRKDIAPPMITTVYEHEYNPERVLNLKKGIIKKGMKILIVDYIIATGSTILAESMLIEHFGASVAGVFSVMELGYLNPRKIIGNYPIHSILNYDTKN